MFTLDSLWCRGWIAAGLLVAIAGTAPALTTVKHAVAHAKKTALHKAAQHAPQHHKAVANTVQHHKVAANTTTAQHHKTATAQQHARQHHTVASATKSQVVATNPRNIRKAATTATATRNLHSHLQKALADLRAANASATGNNVPVAHQHLKAAHQQVEDAIHRHHSGRRSGLGGAVHAVRNHRRAGLGGAVHHAQHHSHLSHAVADIKKAQHQLTAGNTGAATKDIHAAERQVQDAMRYRR